MWLWRHFSKSQMPSEHLLGWGSLGFLDPRIPVFQQIICIFSVIFIYGTPLQYSCLENPMDGGAWWAAVHGVAGVGDNWGNSLSLFTFMQWRRKWQPTPVFLIILYFLLYDISHCMIFLIVLYFLEILIAFMLDFFLFFFLKLHYPWILTLIFIILPLTPFVLCHKSEKKNCLSNYYYSL